MRVFSSRWKIDGRKKNLYEDLSREWTTHHTSELIIGMGEINRHVGRNIDGFLRFMVELVLGKETNREGYY